MQSILSKILYEMEHGKDTALVTIVSDRGSSPRSSGASMLVGEKSRILGTIGGGAIEKHSEELAIKALAEKHSYLHNFLLRKNTTEDLGMVCGGDVTVLFNRIAADDAKWKTVAEAVLNQFSRRIKCWLVRPLSGETPSVYVGGEYVAGEKLPEDVSVALIGTKPLLINNAYFAEPLSAGERVIIFGAGHIAKALSPLVCTVGFKPIIYDDRPEYANRENFPDAEQIICADFGKLSEHIAITGEDYVVIMTNGHSNDYSVQSQIMAGEYAYLGVIGSRAKTLTLNEKLRALGISDERLMAVHTPIGTAIKAVTPEEIAVSIAGELIMVRAQRRSDAK